MREMKKYICRGKEENCTYFFTQTAPSSTCGTHRIPHKLNKHCIGIFSTGHKCECRPLNFEEVMRETIKEHEENEKSSNNGL